MNKTVLDIKDLKLRRSQNFELDIKKLNLNKTLITCLSGANGSGKTTLLEIICGLISPDSGAVRILGADPFREPQTVKAKIGFVPDDEGWIIPELTAREYFQLLNSIYRKNDEASDLTLEVDRLAKQLIFNNFDQQLGSLSHGNRKKVQLIAGMMHSPALLIVDELRNGLDPIASKMAEELLQTYARSGGCVLAATHDLWWAQRMADNAVLIRDGKIILDSKISSILKQADSLEAKFMADFSNES